MICQDMLQCNAVLVIATSWWVSNPSSSIETHQIISQHLLDLDLHPAVKAHCPGSIGTAILPSSFLLDVSNLPHLHRHLRDALRMLLCSPELAIPQSVPDEAVHVLDSSLTAGRHLPVKVRSCQDEFHKGSCLEGQVARSPC